MAELIAHLGEVEEHLPRDGVDGLARLVETTPAPPLGSMPYAGYSEQEVTLGGGDIYYGTVDATPLPRARGSTPICPRCSWRFPVATVSASKT